MHASRFFKTTFFSTVLLAVLSLACTSIVADEIRPKRQWEGKNADAELISAAPADGVVQDSVSWEQLWKSWQPNKAVPPVDFANNIIVVATSRGFNTVQIHRLNLAPGGNLQFSLKVSRTRKPGFGFAMVELPSSEIKELNGRAIKTMEQELVVNPDQKQPSDAQSKDSIQIEVVGLVKSGVVAIGGESTGITITSDGATFELDLKRFRIANPDGKRARVSGQLALKKGVEVKRRWIIDVANIHIFDADQPVEQIKPAFKKIEFQQSGGIAGITVKSVVLADGKVTRVNSRLRVTESFEMKAENLDKAHKLVRETDWEKLKFIPPPAGAADVFQYSIVIETGTKTHRFKLSGLSVQKSEPLSELMKALRNP